jgi:hypothetical protein
MRGGAVRFHMACHVEILMQLICLILEPVVLVADDLVLTIDEVAPGTQVVALTSVAEALSAMQHLHMVDLAFVNLPPDGFAESELGRALADAQAVVVFLGYEVEARAMGLRYLEQPILAESVAGELARRQADGRKSVPGP